MSATSETYEGRQDHIPELSLPSIEVFRNVYAERDYRIELEFPEFTAICPKTGLPDFGTVIIHYGPDQDCLELKSLKEYFLAYRNLGIFHENATNKILVDLVAGCRPRWMEVTVRYGVRGGIATTVVACYPEERNASTNPSRKVGNS